MKRERVGTQQLDETPAFIDAISLVELNRSQVRKERDVGCERANVERLDGIRRFDQRTAGAQSHRKAERLRDASEPPIDPSRLGGAAGHARYQHRRRKLAAENFGRGIDVSEIDLR